MIFFFNAQGNLVESKPENVRQGSNKASRIWFVMPTASTNVVSIAFTLPNGEYAKKRPMTKSSNDLPYKDELGNNINVWYYDLLTDITSYAGKTELSFFVSGSDDELISTQSSEIIVTKGTPSTNLPAQINEYEEIVKALQGVNSIVQTTQEKVQEVEETSSKLLLDFEKLETDTKELVQTTQEKVQEVEETLGKQIANNTNKIASLFNLHGIFAYDNAELTEEIQQTGGADLSELTILDGSYATINKIKGATVATDSGLKHAQISGIRSLKGNLISPDILNNVNKNGITVSVQKDGKVVLKGTPTADYSTTIQMGQIVLPAGIYTLSGAPKKESWKDYYPSLQIRSSSIGVKEDYGWNPNGTTFTISERTICNLSIYAPEEVLGSDKEYIFTPTLNVGSSPVKDIEYKEDTIYLTEYPVGKNLLTQEYLDNMLRENFVLNEDGTYTLSKILYPQNESGYRNSTGSSNIQLPIGTYTFKVVFEDTNPTGVLEINVYFDDGSQGSWGITNKKELTISFDKPIVNFKVVIGGNKSINVPPIETSVVIKNISIQGNQALLLPKWDYVENGQIVRQTAIEDFDRSKYDAEHLIYNGTTDFVISLDGTKVAYRLATPTYEPIIVDNKILSWDKGAQQVLTPKDENGKTCFDDGANTTEEINYYVIVGGKE